MGLKIGQLAKAAGISVETIRYYERRGLIRCPIKPVSGFREYGQPILQRLHFIKRAKSLGFTLDEVEHLFSLSEAECADVQRLAQQKLDQVSNKINHLQRLQLALEQLLDQCHQRPDAAHCPIIETLLDPK
ncbi:MAG: Hg(II)-responsive transcriptional regulator [Gammaproteobacteria bacterium]|nr:Hg(II)-responsive transcriptional regulator [Gammaproteobacteria bacterium]MBL6999424.1 Hg(II)-responsive transcriptional regulator [Gammaproteobacteria bacterium]